MMFHNHTGTHINDFYKPCIGIIKAWSSKYATLMSGVETDDYGTREDIDSMFYTSVSKLLGQKCADFKRNMTLTSI